MVQDGVGETIQCYIGEMVEHFKDGIVNDSCFSIVDSIDISSSCMVKTVTGHAK